MKEKESRVRREETQPSGEISVQASPFLRWLDNYWYHYKWHTIGIAFAVIVVLVCVLQTCSKESYDITFAYAGPTSFTEEEQNGLNQLMEQTMPKDFNGDGEKNATFSRYTVYSKEQILAFEEKGVSINRQYNTEEYDRFNNHLLAGEFSVYLLDPWLYETLKSGERLRPLAEVCSATPVGALEDGFGVRLGDTELYQTYGVLRALPEDTVICLVHQNVIGKNHNDDLYANEVAMFRALVGDR